MIVGQAKLEKFRESRHIKEVIEVRQILGSGPAAGRSPTKQGDLKQHRRIGWAGGQFQKRIRHKEEAGKPTETLTSMP